MASGLRSGLLNHEDRGESDEEAAGPAAAASPREERREESVAAGDPPEDETLRDTAAQQAYDMGFMYAGANRNAARFASDLERSRSLGAAARNDINDALEREVRIQQANALSVAMDGVAAGGVAGLSRGAAANH